MTPWRTNDIDSPTTADPPLESPPDNRLNRPKHAGLRRLAGQYAPPAAGPRAPLRWSGGYFSNGRKLRRSCDVTWVRCSAARRLKDVLKDGKLGVQIVDVLRLSAA